MAINQMQCLLGMQDIPVIQDQPSFVVDLLESNIILYGSSMSGKTNFLKLLITVLHKLYRQDTEQVFILDFGGALAEYESLPLVGAYFDNANEEYVKRVFKLLEDQLKNNVKKLKGKNYRDVSENQPIHTTLVIDNVNAFLDEPRYSSYQEKLGKLCRDGLSKGITVVMTASSTKGTSSLLSSFKQKIALELPEDCYPDIFNQKLAPAGSNPGHGFANVTVNTADNAATYAMQMPYELQLNVADDIHSASFREGLKQHFGGTVTKYSRFPEVLTAESYSRFSGVLPRANTHCADIGLDYTEGKPVTADFDTAKCFAIYGKKDFGKTNLLKLLLKGFLQETQYDFVFFDDGREQLKWFSNQVSEGRRVYFSGYEERKLTYKEKAAGPVKEADVKLSPMQLLIKHIHEYYLDLSQTRRLTNLILNEVFGSGIMLPTQANSRERRNTVFILQSKFLYVTSPAQKIFMEVILPLLVARADEMGWIFIFTDVKPISDSETRDYFHATIGTAFLLDSIAEFVSERGGKTIFGAMDVKALREEYAPCEKGDGYFYSIEKDDLKKLKFIKEPEKEET